MSQYGKLACFSLVVMAMVLAWSGPANADTTGVLTLSNCGNKSGCPAAIYSFDITNTSATLTIQIIGGTSGSNDYIEGVDLGFTAGRNIFNLSVTGPDGASWGATTAGVGNAGCRKGRGPFVCASSTSNGGNGIPIVPGGTYTWTWTFDRIGSRKIASADEVQIGVNYNPRKGLIVSETIEEQVPVPEPPTIALLGAGVLALAFVAWRHPAVNT